ncbi:MAG: ankyrin repeat domain-containing protein [Leptospirales bacterium]|nr:ankyrin repeat domain-containing protein [Leptospirales bacterium]
MKVTRNTYWAAFILIVVLMVRCNSADPERILSAAKQGDLPTVRKAIERGFDVNTRIRGHESLLDTAAMNGHVELVRYLLESGANPNVADRGGWTALHFGVNCTEGERETREIVSLLLQRGANVNAQDSTGFTPLMYAATKMDGELVRMLLRGGADPNIKNSVGMTARELAELPQYNIADVVEAFDFGNEPATDQGKN